MTNREPDADDIIIRLLANDDERAIDKLHALYYERLFFSVRKLIRNKQDAAAILNDLLFTIWEKRHSLSLHKPLLFYLHRAARNRALNFLLSSSRTREIPTDPDVLNTRPEPVGTDVGDPLMLEDLKFLWLVAEIHMTYRIRQTFLMTHQDHKTPEEIAQHMSITVNAVQMNLSRAWKVIEKIKRLYFGVLLAGSLIAF